jgi:DivIVA domain-containing protein
MERLKPVDVRNVAFSKPRPGRRGYDETEVDTFLDLVERTLSQLYHEIALLRGEPTTPGGVGVLQLALPSGPSGAPSSPPPSGTTSNDPPVGLVILAELDQIKLRLARIESQVAASRPAERF